MSYRNTVYSFDFSLLSALLCKQNSSNLPRSVSIQIKNDMLKLLVYLPPKTQH